MMKKALTEKDLVINSYEETINKLNNYIQGQNKNISYLKSIITILRNIVKNTNIPLQDAFKEVKY